MWCDGGVPSEGGGAGRQIVDYGARERRGFAGAALRRAFAAEPDSDEFDRLLARLDDRETRRR
jgi:hypothetical protein